MARGLTAACETSHWPAEVIAPGADGGDGYGVRLHRKTHRLVGHLAHGVCGHQHVIPAVGQLARRSASRQRLVAPATAIAVVEPLESQRIRSHNVGGQERHAAGVSHDRGKLAAELRGPGGDQRQAEVFPGRNTRHVVQPSGHIRHPQVSLAPGEDGAIRPQRQVVIIAGGDPNELVADAGTADWPYVLSPQAITDPSARNARQCSQPAATATTLLAVGGVGIVKAPGHHGPIGPQGHVVVVAGGNGDDIQGEERDSRSGHKSLFPQATTVPSALSARLCAQPAAMATTLVAVGGTLVCPSQLRPQATTEPSSLNARLWAAAGGDRNHIRRRRRHVGLAVPVLSPGSHGSVRIQSQTVGSPGGDRAGRVSCMGHIALSVDVVAPGTDGRADGPCCTTRFTGWLVAWPRGVRGHQNVASRVGWSAY